MVSSVIRLQFILQKSSIFVDGDFKKRICVNAVYFRLAWVIWLAWRYGPACAGLVKIGRMISYDKLQVRSDGVHLD